MSILTDDSHVDLRNKSGVVAFDQTISQVYGAPRMCGNIALVRDENDRVPALIQIFEQCHDLFAGLGIEVASRFVSQNDGGPVDKRTRDSYALALTAREFVRFVMNPIAQANIGQNFRRTLFARLRIDPRVNER